MTPQSKLTLTPTHLSQRSHIGEVECFVARASVALNLFYSQRTLARSAPQSSPPHIALLLPALPLLHPSLILHPITAHDWLLDCWEIGFCNETCGFFSSCFEQVLDDWFKMMENFVNSKDKLWNLKIGKYVIIFNWSFF